MNCERSPLVHKAVPFSRMGSANPNSMSEKRHFMDEFLTKIFLRLFEFFLLQTGI
jgi:hypothetical protein